MLRHVLPAITLKLRNKRMLPCVLVQTLLHITGDIVHFNNAHCERRSKITSYLASDLCSFEPDLRLAALQTLPHFPIELFLVMLVL